MPKVTQCPHCHMEVDAFSIEACQRSVCLKSYQVTELDPSLFGALFPEAVITKPTSLAFEETLPGDLSSKSDDPTLDFWATIPGSLHHR